MEPKIRTTILGMVLLHNWLQEDDDYIKQTPDKNNYRPDDDDTLLSSKMFFCLVRQGNANKQSSSVFWPIKHACMNLCTT